MRLMIAATGVFLLFGPSVAWSTSALYTDRFRNITGTLELEESGEKKERKVDLVIDQFGNITGTVGDANTALYKDAFGNITGTIGKKEVDLYEDAFGNLTGTIGDQKFDCYRDAFGTTECK